MAFNATKDLYALLGVDERATLKEIKKAYRRQSLCCHPDKNLDNPKAAELFHQLSQALEVLTDAAARAAYDKVRTAKRQAEERNNRLDDERKKFKLDLEAREKQAEAQREEELQATRMLQEIARLREEGTRLLQEEQKRIQEEREQRVAHAGLSSAQQDNRMITPKLKLKWKSKKDDDTNGGYSKEILQSLLHKYGDILNIIVSSTKKGSGLVEFATVKGAERAFKYERGLIGKPLKITWLEGQPENTDSTTVQNSTAGAFTSSQTPLGSERDYESLVLMRMRQAAERQKIINQLMQEDAEDAV